MESYEKLRQEMAQDICNACKKYRDCAKEHCTLPEVVTVELIEKYQPKLPKESIVLTKEQIKQHDYKIANDVITLFQTMAVGWASADIVNDTAKRLRKLYGVDL